MATRTIKFMGKAYSTDGTVSLTVNFNGSQVFSGTVATENSATPTKPEETAELFTFETTTDVTGEIPLSVSVSGGDLVFDSLFGNYSGSEVDNTDPENPVVVTAPVNYYSDMNTNSAESDGKNNVQIDGVEQPRNPQNEEEAAGEWFYVVPNGSTLTCDYTIDANKIVLE